MQDVLNRQLIAPAVAVFVILALAAASAEEPRAANAAEQLQAAKLMEAALTLREAKADEWQKLDATYAALAAQNPRDAAVRNARGEFLWDRGEQARAVAEWETAVQLDPQNSAALAHLGGSALERGETRQAADFFARAVASDPANAASHFALANVQFLFRHDLLDATHPDADGLLTDALAHFASAARLAPASAEYARAYAETFYSVPSPDWTAALAAWENFQHLSPQQDFARLHLARVQLKLGNLDAAQTCLAQVQSADYQTLKTRLEAQLHSRQAAAAK
jgi:tetratricopeptide (TPR) repeat protein